jgi:DUF4097 and DUF4098 domain-containing protein YvlB
MRVLHRRQVLGLIALSAAALLGAAPAAKSRIERTVAVPGGIRFVLDTDGGTVVVRGTARGDARVLVTSSAEDLESKIRVEIEQSAGEVRVVSRKKKGSGSSWFGLFGSNTPSLRFEVEVPQRTPVGIDTAGGHVEASALEADAVLDTSGGSITVADHQGRLKANTSGGHIRLERIRGDADVHTSGGRIEARDVRGSLAAVTSGGSIEIAEVSGDLRAKTSGGSIRIVGAGGRVQAETSGGSVEATFKPGNARGGVLDSSAGSVRVALDPSIDLSIDASSSAGSVRSELPLEGTLSRSAVKGTLGKGGNLLRLHTSAGSVEIGPL